MKFGNNEIILNTSFQVSESMFDKLNLIDLLRLRQTCTSLFNFVHGYSKFQNWLTNETVLFRSLEDVDKFNKAIFSLDFSRYVFHFPLKSCDELLMFSKNTSKKVIRLALAQIDSPFSSFEASFLESLIQLKELYINIFKKPEMKRGKKILPIEILGRLETFSFLMLKIWKTILSNCYLSYLK